MLEAFAAFTRDATHLSEAYEVVRAAQEILASLLPGVVSVYYELDGDTWRCRTQVGQHPPQVQALVDAGRPYAASGNIVTAWESRRPLFVDAYDPGVDAQGLLLRDVSAGAYPPLIMGGEGRGLLTVVCWGASRGWSRTDQGLMTALTHSLELALEGVGSTRALQDRTRDLERSNAELERFAYVASHDLQEPLRTIASFTELLEQRYAEVYDERGRTFLRMIVQGAVRMKTLVDDLLVYSRLGAEQLTMAPVPVDRVVAETLERLTELQAQTAGGVTVGALPTVHGNEPQLTQLFLNLIGNALKFHRPGVPPQIRIEARRDGACWLFSVADNGIGIEKQYFDKIFVMFQRLHLREQYAGTGLGLAICRKVVERHGGRMWVESTPEVGSTFYFTLGAVGGSED